MAKKSKSAEKATSKGQTKLVRITLVLGLLLSVSFFFNILMWFSYETHAIEKSRRIVTSLELKHLTAAEMDYVETLKKCKTSSMFKDGAEDTSKCEGIEYAYKNVGSNFRELVETINCSPDRQKQINSLAERMQFHGSASLEFEKYSTIHGKTKSEAIVDLVQLLNESFEVLRECSPF